ncbi:MAG: DUF456 domain-containing protein, partial [Gemmatimonadales bacterium]
MSTAGLVLVFGALLVGLALLPFGLPGLWLMGGALLVHGLATGFHPFGGWFVGGVLTAAALAELLDFWLSMRFTEHYGGSRRSAWAAVAGGLVGALVGVPVPVVGSV